MSLKIRKARIRDLNKIVEYYGPVGDSPTDHFSSVQRLRQLDLEQLLVAEQDGQFAGFLYHFIHKKPWFDPNVDRYASIQELHVLSEFRNRGIATSLLKTALSEIRRKGIKTVYVDTGEDNEVALHIYRKEGFRDLRKDVKLKLTM